MKETISTIPLTDAFSANDECPFCYLEREAEQHAISFILGSAYMEDDIREETDAVGFCRHHFKMMYDYGNRLGSALILSTHLKKINRELSEERERFTQEKAGIFRRKKRAGTAAGNARTPLGAWVRKKEQSCYVCDHFRRIYSLYLDTFFDLYRKSDEFRTIFENCKGFCLPHFGDLVETAAEKLNAAQKEAFYQNIFSLMQEHIDRVQKDVSWFVEKNDYRNKDKDWGNAADSIQRAMQKCAGGYPADAVFKANP